MVLSPQGFPARMEVIKVYMQKLVQKIGHRVMNADRSVRIEDVLRRSNKERRRITANRISCLFLLIGVCIVIFLVGAYVLLSYGLPYIKKADVVDVDMRLGIINDTSISLETKLSLQPYFQKRVNLKFNETALSQDSRVLSEMQSQLRVQDMRTHTYAHQDAFRRYSDICSGSTARQHKTDVKGTTSSVPKSITDNGKRKVKTCDDSNVFQAYSALCARNVRPHCLSNVPEPADVPNFGGTQNDSCDFTDTTNQICPSGSLNNGRSNRKRLNLSPPPVEAVDSFKHERAQHTISEGSEIGSNYGAVTVFKEEVQIPPPSSVIMHSIRTNMAAVARSPLPLVLNHLRPNRTWLGCWNKRHELTFVDIEQNIACHIRTWSTRGHNELFENDHKQRWVWVLILVRLDVEMGAFGAEVGDKDQDSWELTTGEKIETQLQNEDITGRKGNCMDLLPLLAYYWNSYIQQVDQPW
ncbi:hypothetical protein Tco_0045858 [Tanacetum coccineum]